MQRTTASVRLAAIAIIAAASICGVVSPARAAEITVLSGQAVEPALIAAADVFRERTGIVVRIVFATTPQIRQRIGAGETPDVVIAPPEVLDQFAKSGHVSGSERASLGAVGIGVVIRDGAPKPDVSTTEALKRAVLDADTVIYNQASSGLYVEELLKRLGLAEQIQAKTKRYVGTEMIEPLINGKGREIGFLPLVQILKFRGKGLQLAGPLPADVQHSTIYAAVPAPKSEGGSAFVRFLGTAEGKAIFASLGIE
jgi:molybdate transport system substrate-binding protein